jgi:hypothetical protein
MAWCGGLRADHGQKHDPGDEIIIPKGLDEQRPITKHYFGGSSVLGLNEHNVIARALAAGLGFEIAGPDGPARSARTFLSHKA